MTADQIVYVDRSRVRPGKLDELRDAMAELVSFVEANVPRMLAYHVYLDADDHRMTVIHVHDDPASLAEHLRIAGPEFPPIGELVELEAVDVYGHPGEDLVRQLEEKASMLGTGRVTVHEHHDGVSRFRAD